MANPRKLKQEAMAASGSGSWRKAATCYANLEKLEPADPTWSLKLGECLRKMGNDEEAIKAFSRAATGYAKQEMLLKAIAVCKIILSIDAKHTRTQDLLTALHGAQEGPTAVAASPSATPPAPVPTARPVTVVPPGRTAVAPVAPQPRRPLTPLPPARPSGVAPSSTAASPPLSPAPALGHAPRCLGGGPARHLGRHGDAHPH